MQEQSPDHDATVCWLAQCSHYRLGSIRCHVIDISINGVLFTYYEQLRVGETLDMQVIISPTESILCTVEVVLPHPTMAKKDVYGGRFFRIFSPSMRLLTQKLLEVRRKAENRRSVYQPMLFYPRANMYPQTISA